VKEINNNIQINLETNFKDRKRMIISIYQVQCHVKVLTYIPIQLLSWIKLKYGLHYFFPQSVNQPCQSDPSVLFIFFMWKFLRVFHMK